MYIYTRRGSRVEQQSKNYDEDEQQNHEQWEYNGKVFQQNSGNKRFPRDEASHGKSLTRCCCHLPPGAGAVNPLLCKVQHRQRRGGRALTRVRTEDFNAGGL